MFLKVNRFLVGNWCLCRIQIWSSLLILSGLFWFLSFLVLIYEFIIYYLKISIAWPQYCGWLLHGFNIQDLTFYKTFNIHKSSLTLSPRIYKFSGGWLGLLYDCHLHPESMEVPNQYYVYKRRRTRTML